MTPHVSGVLLSEGCSVVGGTVRFSSMSPVGCDCRLHRSGPYDDNAEAKTVADVAAYGYHRLVVSDAFCEDEHLADAQPEPEFAYTVGLWHSRSHPELLVSGLPLDLMGAMLGACADRILRGEQMSPGTLWEDVLGGVAVTSELMIPTVVARTATWAKWFHRAPVPVLQIVWPDTAGRFAWQLDNSAVLDERQPPDWRTPGPRDGLLAPQPTLPESMDGSTIAFVCRHITEEGAPVLYAAHDLDEERGEEWVFLCEPEEHDTDDLAIQHLIHIAVRNPSIVELANLPIGSDAERASSGTAWLTTTA